MKERFKPGFLRERAAINAQERAVELANEKGVSPDLLNNLGRAQSEIDLDKPNNKALWVGIGVMLGSGIAFAAGTQIPEDLTIDQFWIDLVNSQLQFSPVKLTANKIKDIEQGVAALVGSSAFVYVILRYISSRAENSVRNLGRKLRLKDKADALQDTIERGESKIDIGPGHVVIDLGTDGDAIGGALGRRLGWTKGSIPLVEGEENVSDSPLWVKAHNPTHALKKEDFFASLERARFDSASAFVICSLNQDQAFLPNLDYRSHIGLKPSVELSPQEVLDRIALVDRYCRERRLPTKKIVVIGDKTVRSAVGPSYGKGRIQPISEFSLEELIVRINDEREEKVIIADPTEIALSQLRSPRYNPKGLPLRFFESPYAAETYGGRFIERGRALGIDVVESGDDKRESLNIVYGDRDVDTAHLAGMINGKLSSYLGTVSVIIDEARAIGEPHNTIVLSNVVPDWIISRLN